MKNNRGYKILLTVLIFFASFFECFSQNGTKVDSLKTLLQTAKADTTLVNTLGDLAWELQYTKPDEAIRYAERSLRLADKLSFLRGACNANNVIGGIKSSIGEYPEALKYYNEAFTIMQELNNKKGLANILGNIGGLYLHQGDYPNALECYFQSLKIGKELENSELIGFLLGNIGITYREQGDYTLALKYYFQSLEIREELGAKSSIAILLNNIGLVYTDQAEYAKALEYYHLALPLIEELGYKSYAGTLRGNIGTVYHKQGNASKELWVVAEYYAKAQEYYFQALRIAQQTTDKQEISRWLGNIGVLYFEQAQYDKSESYLLKALELSNEIGVVNLQNDQYLQLSDLYRTTKQYQKALKYYKEYTITKDSLFNDEKSKDIGKLEARHEFEAEALEQKRKNEELKRIETAAKERRDNLQYSGILIFIVLLFIGVFMLGRFSIPVKLAEGMVFFSFLLFFEFTLVLLDPYIERYSSAGPAVKLVFNALLAGLIFPLHAFFESKLKNRIIK